LIPEAKNRSQALQAEKAIINALFDKKYGTPKTPTLKDFIESIYLSWAKINKKSWKTDRSHCAVLVRFFGKKPLDQISPFEIERFKKLHREEKTKTGKLISATTVNRSLEGLGKIFNLALREGVVSQNPCRNVAKLKIRSQRYRILSSEEEQRLLAVLVGRRAYLLDLVRLDLATGLRKSELLNLRWENVNLPQSVLAIKNTKTGRDRFIPLTPVAQDALNVGANVGAKVGTEWLLLLLPSWKAESLCQKNAKGLLRRNYSRV
jgi:integrase